MKLFNPLKMNDWKISNLFILISILQIGIIALIFLDKIGLGIPFLLNTFSIVYLLFIPGVLILRILKIHNLNNVSSLIYQIALSISFIYFVGFLINLFFPMVGIKNPLSNYNVLITFIILTTIMSYSAYMRDGNFHNLEYIKIKNVLSNSSIFLFMLPIFSILGAFMVTYYQNNVINLSLIVLISLTVIFVAFGIIKKQHYPLAVYTISLSLLLQMTLISTFLNGADIQAEYFYYLNTISNGFWNYALAGDSSGSITYNAMLSSTILPGVLSAVSQINGIWIFKLIFPIIFAFVPLGLYEVYRRQSNSLLAFLAAFFFSAFFVFYNDMTFLVKQQVAEFFFVVILMVLTERKINSLNKKFIGIISLVSLVVSHYGLSYIFILILIISLLIYYILRRFYFIKTTDSNMDEMKLITGGVFLFLVVFALVWYIYIGGSNAFSEMVKSAYLIYFSIFTDFLNSQSTEGLNLILLQQGSILHSIGKYIQYISIFFITIGILYPLLTKKLKKISLEFYLISLACFIICIFSFTVPNFSSALNTTRMYHITLLTLSLFFVLGVIVFIKFFSQKIGYPSLKMSGIKLISIFLVIFLLFNTGFIYEIFNDQPNSLSISTQHIKNGNPKQKIGYYDYYTIEQDYFAQEWISKYTAKNSTIYKPFLPRFLTEFKDQRKVVTINNQTNTIGTKENTYLFIGYISLVANIMTYERLQARGLVIPYRMNETDLSLDKFNKISTNGGSDIYSTGVKN